MLGKHVLSENRLRTLVGMQVLTCMRVCVRITYVCLQAVGDIPGAAAITQAIGLMRRKEFPMASVLHEELLYNDPFTSVYSKFRTMHPAEDCLVRRIRLSACRHSMQTQCMEQKDSWT